MPIEVGCSCGRGLKVQDQAAGQRVKCPACGSIVQVPGQHRLPNGPSAPLAESRDPSVARCLTCGSELASRVDPASIRGIVTNLRGGYTRAGYTWESVLVCPRCSGVECFVDSCPEQAARTLVQGWRYKVSKRETRWGHDDVCLCERHYELRAAQRSRAKAQRGRKSFWIDKRGGVW